MVRMHESPTLSYAPSQNTFFLAFAVPVWQIGPTPRTQSILLLDLYSNPSFRRMIDDALIVRRGLLSEVIDFSFITGVNTTYDESKDGPQLFGIQPVFEAFEDSAPVVGFIFVVFSWSSVFNGILASDARGVLAEVHDTCGSNFTYQFDASVPRYLGTGILRDTKYNPLEHRSEFAEFARFGQDTNPFIVHCEYSASVFPTREFEELNTSSARFSVPLGIAMVFVFTAFVFALYNFMVERRQDTVMATAARTSALVSSLFPEEFQDRVLDDAVALATDDGMTTESWDYPPLSMSPRKQQKKVKSFFKKEGSFPSPPLENRPIADIYSSVSIIFADLVGFTAWSSIRDPSQVFRLLETLYSTYDANAKVCKIYKIETIGDCM